MTKNNRAEQTSGVLETFDYAAFESAEIAGLQNGAGLIGTEGVLTVLVQRAIIFDFILRRRVHGGGWLGNDKYADMGYMKKTIVEIVNSGFALASIDYRFSTQAVFPAQIQDCNRAVSFLYDNAGRYGLDKERFSVMGFSAGGHLASLMGLSKNNNISTFFMPNTSKTFNFKAVVDFYGPAELILFPKADDPKSPESLLIGAAPIDRPDLAKIASPVTYVDKNDPPFLIIHGEKDDLVSNKHSKLLSAWLTAVGVQNELIIVKDAPHFGTMYDVDAVRNKVIDFLKKQLK